MPQYVVTVQSRRVVLFTAQIKVEAPDPDTARRLATEKAAHDRTERDWAASEEVEHAHWAGAADVREVP